MRVPLRSRLAFLGSLLAVTALAAGCGQSDQPSRVRLAKTTFISRGDKSGTHSREKKLWAKAAARPPWDGYKEAGQGMGPTLLMADEKKSYTLSDRSTFVSMRKKLGLVVLYEGGADLLN